MGHDSITVERWHEVTWCQVSEHPIIPISPIFWVGVINGVGEKIAPYFKGTPALPPLDWEKSQHYKWWCDVWRCGVSNGIVEYHIDNSENRMGSWTPNCLLLDLVGFSTLRNVCLPPPRGDSCWSLFVRVHKFLFGEIMLSSFFQKSDILFLLKTRIGWD